MLVSRFLTIALVFAEINLVLGGLSDEANHFAAKQAKQAIFQMTFLFCFGTLLLSLKHEIRNMI